MTLACNVYGVHAVDCDAEAFFYSRAKALATARQARWSSIVMGYRVEVVRASNLPALVASALNRGAWYVDSWVVEVVPPEAERGRFPILQAIQGGKPS